MFFGGREGNVKTPQPTSRELHNHPVNREGTLIGDSVIILKFVIRVRIIGNTCDLLTLGTAILNVVVYSCYPQGLAV